MTVQGLDRRIEITPGICAGKPRIAGHRITLHDVAIWQQRMGISADEIDDAFVAAHPLIEGPCYV